MKNRLLAVCALMGCSLGIAAPGSETNVPAGSTLRLGVVAERLIVSVELSSAATSQSISLMVDLAAPTTLTLRDDVFLSLKLAEEGEVTLSAAGGFRASVPRARLKPCAGTLDLDRASTLHAAALDDRPLAGTIGAGFLQNYYVVVDVQSKELKLLPRDSVEPGAGLMRSVSIREGQIRVPVTYGAGTNAEMLLASTEYDTRVDPGARIGDGPVRITARSEAIDLARYIAFRPAPSSGDVPIRSGIDLLEHFRVGIDWARKQVVFLETRPPGDLAADREFFKAEAAGTIAAIAEFIRLHPQSRFREEAAQRLLNGRLAEGADDAAIVSASRAYLEAVPETNRGQVALNLVEQMQVQHPSRAPVIIGVGEVALEAAHGDPKSLERYQIHRLLGTVRLANGDIEGAWKNFLAAVFGLPEDAQVNLNLARIYEKQGRLGRAFSRYQLTASLVQKNANALTEAERAEVKAAVDRLRSKVGKNAP